MNQKERLVEQIQLAVDGTARHWAEVIADYLLDDGWFRPPVKAGDTVYAIFGKTIKELFVKYINIHKNDIEVVVFPKDENEFGYRFGLNKLGKAVFLDREDAEKVLKGGVEE